MNNPVLVVMAAGMGSRYGGLKQIDPVGNHGEALLDYSIYDAWQAGFETTSAYSSARIKRVRADRIRKELDKEGFEDCSIVVSNSLDEYIIRDTLSHGAQIDSFGVGERLITARSWPVFGGVYKLVGVEEDGEIVPKIKISENAAKITTPDFKQVYRLYDNETGKAIADVMTLHNEVLDDSQPYEIFDPVYTWKRKKVKDFTAKPLLVQIFDKGECCYQSPDIKDIKKFCNEQVETLWDEVKRFENPHRYYVDLSKKLWDIKQALLENRGR